MSPLLIGILSTGITEIAKRHPKFPLSATNVIAIRSLVGILSVVGVVLTGIANGDLASINWEDIIGKIIEAATAFFAATGVYKLFDIGKKN